MSSRLRVPSTTFLLSFELPGTELGSMAELPTILTNKPNTQVKDCHLYLYLKPFHSAEWWTCISQWLKIHFTIFLLSTDDWKPKVSIYSVSVDLCLPLCKVWWSKVNNWLKRDVLKFVPVSEQGAETTFHEETAIFFWLNVTYMLIDHHDQQIVWWKTCYLKLCFETNVGTNQAKIEKISISWAILLGFLRSLVSAILCEANKSKWQREERSIG